MRKTPLKSSNLYHVCLGYDLNYIQGAQVVCVPRATNLAEVGWRLDVTCLAIHCQRRGRLGAMGHSNLPARVLDCGLRLFPQRQGIIFLLDVLTRLSRLRVRPLATRGRGLLSFSLDYMMYSDSGLIDRVLQPQQAQAPDPTVEISSSDKQW